MESGTATTQAGRRRRVCFCCVGMIDAAEDGSLLTERAAEGEYDGGGWI